MYVCGFLKLASLSKLIFGRFFLKKEKEKLVGSIYICVCVCVFFLLSILPPFTPSIKLSNHLKANKNAFVTFC